MIGKMNSQVTVKRWGSSQDDAGGLIAVELLSWIMWAMVENRSGRTVTNESQSEFTYDYKITFRYENSRPVKSKDTIDYDGMRMSIGQLSFLNEGKRKFAIARCTALENLVTDDVTTFGVKNYSYYGVAHETSWSTPFLIGKTIITAFKDGIAFEVLLSGSPVGKQVVYNSGTGSFTWGAAYDPNEYTLIQYT